MAKTPLLVRVGPHRHRWEHTTKTCDKCGLTRGRASRIDGDLATIERYLASPELAEKLSKMDPVNFAITISSMRAAARERHSKVIADAVSAKTTKDLAELTAKLTATMAKVPLKISLSKSKSSMKPKGTMGGSIGVNVTAMVEDTPPTSATITVMGEEL